MVDAATGADGRKEPAARVIEAAMVACGQFGDWLRASARADASRLSLWAPVALGAGAACYLLAPEEPPFFVAPCLAVLAAIGATLKRVRQAAILSLIVLVGFMAADLRAMSVDAPVLKRDIKFALVRGRIDSIDERTGLRRIVISVDNIENLNAKETPARVRISWRGKIFDADPGDKISIKAALSPPPTPAAPGGFDFARQLYFQRIGAVGYAVAPPEVLDRDRASNRPRISAAIERLRVNLARRIEAKATGEGGAIVAAVVTGKRGAISDEAEAAFRDSGLAHLLAISGLHMGLATGLIFFAVRALLAMIEGVALRQPIKKWAAIAALISGAVYLVISGSSWSAQRAYVMSSIFFVAILFDRRALTLRNVAIAAFIIILIAPEAVLHPGFQMSFAAVTALIAAYEWASRRADPNRSQSALAKSRRYFFGIAATDTIAAAATAPFSLYHFNRAANFGLPANLVSIPIMAFWVMPAAITAILLAPFNLDGPLWRLSASGVDVILFMARWTMNLPGAVSVFPQWPPAALGLISVGGLWLCLMTASWRLLGLAALPVAAIMIASEPHPDIYVSDNGDNAGFVTKHNGKRGLSVLDRSKSRFDAQVWMEQAGIDIARVRPEKLNEVAPCDESGCVVQVDGATIAVSSRRDALDDDCRRAAFIIALYPVSKTERQRCDAAILDRRDAWSEGAHEIFVEKGAVSTKSSSSLRGDRPWTK